MRVLIAVDRKSQSVRFVSHCLDLPITGVTGSQAVHGVRQTPALTTFLPLVERVRNPSTGIWHGMVRENGAYLTVGTLGEVPASPGCCVLDFLFLASAEWGDAFLGFESLGSRL